MQSPPISQAEIDARIRNHLDELLELWWAKAQSNEGDGLRIVAYAPEQDPR